VLFCCYSEATGVNPDRPTTKTIRKRKGANSLSDARQVIPASRGRMSELLTSSLLLLLHFYFFLATPTTGQGALLCAHFQRTYRGGSSALYRNHTPQEDPPPGDQGFCSAPLVPRRSHASKALAPNASPTRHAPLDAFASPRTDKTAALPAWISSTEAGTTPLDRTPPRGD